MREIKFRAWHKKEKSMWHVRLFDFDQEVIWLVEQGEEGMHEQAFPCKPDEIVLMPYTGLKDKSGNEIYEGDITMLRLSWGETRYFKVSFSTVTREILTLPNFEGKTAKVEINAVTFDWKEYQLFPMIHDGISDVSKMEVVGNIYENPELLEAVK